MLASDVHISIYNDRKRLHTFMKKMIKDLCHKPEKYKIVLMHLASLKAVLFHIGNKHNFITIGYDARVKNTYTL